VAADDKLDKRHSVEEAMTEVRTERVFLVHDLIFARGGRPLCANARNLNVRNRSSKNQDATR
jgi:hypothetical protein